MADREKVMTWLEICGKNNECSGCCPYSENGFGEYGQCRESLMADAYDLLKEQEAVVPYSMNADRTYGICPKCGKIVFRYGNVEENHYCGVCGKAVKWNECR